MFELQTKQKEPPFTYTNIIYIYIIYKKGRDIFLIKQSGKKKYKHYTSFCFKSIFNNTIYYIHISILILKITDFFNTYFVDIVRL